MKPYKITRPDANAILKILNHKGLKDAMDMIDTYYWGSRLHRDICAFCLEMLVPIYKCAKPNSPYLSRRIAFLRSGEAFGSEVEQIEAGYLQDQSDLLARQGSYGASSVAGAAVKLYAQRCEFEVWSLASQIPFAELLLRETALQKIQRVIQERFLRRPHPLRNPVAWRGDALRARIERKLRAELEAMLK